MPYSPKILVVDDEPRMRDSLKSLLSRRTYVIQTAENGEKAIDLLSSAFFDLVITNLCMGDIGGIAVLEKAKMLIPDAMVIIHSGYGTLDSAIEALRLDADDYILKPCDPEDFYLRVERCLAKGMLKRKLKLYQDFLPVCSVCRKVRDDTDSPPGAGPWMSWEKYMRNKAGIRFTSTYCPECGKKALDDLNKLLPPKKK